MLSLLTAPALSGTPAVGSGIDPVNGATISRARRGQHSLGDSLRLIVDTPTPEAAAPAAAVEFGDGLKIKGRANC